MLLARPCCFKFAEFEWAVPDWILYGFLDLCRFETFTLCLLIYLNVPSAGCGLRSLSAFLPILSVYSKCDHSLMGHAASYLLSDLSLIIIKDERDWLIARLSVINCFYLF